MSWILTYTGVHFDPVDPKPDQIRLRDIAHALSMICRGCGHVSHFYSVAQHSLSCFEEARTRGFSERLQLACLLHDASEAYLSDVTRPIKSEMARYLEVEDRLQKMIWCHYLGTPLNDEELEAVFAIDDDMLAYEFHRLMREEISEPYVEKIAADISCGYRDPRKVEEEFLQTAKGLINEKDHKGDSGHGYSSNCKKAVIYPDERHTGGWIVKNAKKKS